jgi:hypothetical protein
VVQQHTSAQSVVILVRDAPASYAFAIGVPAPEVSENDSAIVALRAWNKPVDLHAFPESELHGDLAFPMLSRGQLVGLLICGPKHDGEAYAPDESEALLARAHAVGVTLDTLTNQSHGFAASIRQTQEQILLELQNLPQALTSALRDGSNGTRRTPGLGSNSDRIDFVRTEGEKRFLRPSFIGVVHGQRSTIGRIDVAS